ncbi:MAG: hypothetical protein P0Y65_05785 [Candidatus Devosia phytovorans]|uniref:Uncharacterized protein n=1 Tax=Candidatus Devosia phytovorans TaxID=3121372 RepID=A0AAJ6B1G6_9HYPH|nr:hypothetical protein [Devosia sp.]WEK05766.1 MAG: hypothetical protein P0Y65_05785 [Devosia sp.]
MAEVELKVLLDDVRARDVALFNTIAASDRQSVALFRIYVTMILALMSGIAALVAAPPFAERPWLVSGAIIAAIGLAGACWLCFRAIKTANVGAPGRSADFWQWATRPDVTEEALIEEYLKKSFESQTANHLVNAKSGFAMRWAKRLGLSAVILGGLVAVIGVTNLWSYVETYRHSLGSPNAQAAVAAEAAEAVEAVGSGPVDP